MYYDTHPKYSNFSDKLIFFSKAAKASFLGLNAPSVSLGSSVTNKKVHLFPSTKKKTNPVSKEKVCIDVGYIYDRLSNVAFASQVPSWALETGNLAGD